MRVQRGDGEVGGLIPRFLARTQRKAKDANHSSNPFTILVMPSLIRATLKLINRPRRLSANLQIAQELLLVDGSDFRNRLDLDDDFVFDHQVRSKPCLKASPFVHNRYWLLGCRT